MKLAPVGASPWLRSESTAVALGLLCVALAACSGTAARTGAPTAPVTPSLATPAATTAGGTLPAGGAATHAAGSACGLVTPVEVAAATGQSMAVSGDAGAICTFSATADPSLVLYVQIYNDVPGMSLMMQLESGSDHMAGMGDDAFWNGTVGTMFVRKGNRGFSLALPSLSNLTASPAAIQSRMSTLASEAFGRF